MSRCKISFPSCLFSYVFSNGNFEISDLGVHIDGYCAVVADSVVATEEVEAEFTGKVADLFHAINTAMEAALRLVKVGAKNTAVTEAFEKIAESYGVNMIQGVLSHDMKKFLIDGNRVILSKTDSETKVDEFDFELNEVFALDIVMSTGDGKPREVDEKTTVYKRNPDVNYKLKMKASNYVLGEINHRFPAFPFSLRHLDEKKGRLGILELLNHGLVNDYPVLLEKDGEFVAHFKATLLLLPSGTLRITGKPIDLARFKTEKSIEDENLKALLSQDLKSKKKKNKKKKPAKAADEDNAE